MADRVIEDQQYYHGLLPRTDIKSMLQRNGDFLVRITEPHPGNPRQFVLSVMFDELREEHGLKHFIIIQNNGKYSVERFTFDTIPEMVEFHRSRQESVSKNAQVFLKTPILRQQWELSHDDIEVTKKLGEGAFGEVSLGILRLKEGKKVDVAIKLAKLETLTKEQINEVMTEARLMRMFNHPHVVKLYGVAAGREPLMIVMELADNGSLDSYLRKNEQPINTRVEMCMGAGWGIEYLHSKLVIHRDIAARNCLYGGNKVKISDFGLTREGTTYEMDPRHKVPIRWLAPEVLRTAMYSQKTDVYSFGILCWEILAQGQEPYPGMTVAEVSMKVLRDKYRMPLPPDTPQDVALVIEKGCWAESPNDRLSMPMVCKKFEIITHLSRPQTQSRSDAARDMARKTMREARPEPMGLTSKEKRKKKRNH